MNGYAPAGLDITTASVTADPGLLSANPDMMTTASHAFASAAEKLHATWQVSVKASEQLSTYWLGKGYQGFDTASTKANADANVAADALTGAAAALKTLSSQIAHAQSLAHQALRLAADSAQAASALQSAYAASSAEAVAALPAKATPEQVLAARGPTPGQVAQAEAISAEAAHATRLMAEANSIARQGWSCAAAAFDAVTAQAPSIRAAVTRARAKAAAAHQGGEDTLGAIGNLLGAALLPIGSGAADILSDGYAAAATPGEADAEDSLISHAVSDFEGDTRAEIASAEQEAAAEASVDGTKVGSEVADDVTADTMKVGDSTVGKIQEAIENFERNPATAKMFEGYSAFGDDTPKQLLKEYFDPEARNGKGGWNYSKELDNGAVPGTVHTTPLHVGDFVDRFGKPDGHYLSPDGTPYGARSLPPDSVTKGYYRYKVLQEFTVQQGIVGADFGQDGGGLQFFTGDRDVQWLVKKGYLEELK